MIAITSAYINALLADAAYVGNIGGGGINASRFEPRLTTAQANFLAANFTVAASHESPIGGFDAVVWQIKPGSVLAGINNENAGRIYVSMRGTQGGQDIADDISLASRGIPYEQVRDMVNWWLRATTSAQANAQRIAWTFGETDPVTGEVISPRGYVLTRPVAGTGELTATTSIASVNGHGVAGMRAGGRFGTKRGGCAGAMRHKSVGFVGTPKKRSDTHWSQWRPGAGHEHSIRAA